MEVLGGFEGLLLGHDVYTLRGTRPRRIFHLYLFQHIHGTADGKSCAHRRIEPALTQQGYCRPMLKCHAALLWISHSWGHRPRAHLWGVSCAEPHVTHGTGPSHSPHHRHGSHVTHFPNGAPHHYVCVTYPNPHIHKHTHICIYL